MSQVQTSVHCAHCGEQTLHAKPRINHVLHLILSVLTLGLWALFVWLPLGMINSAKGVTCQRCGTKISETKAESQRVMGITPGKP